MPKASSNANPKESFGLGPSGWGGVSQGVLWTFGLGRASSNAKGIPLGKDSFGAVWDLWDKGAIVTIFERKTAFLMMRKLDNGPKDSFGENRLIRRIPLEGTGKTAYRYANPL